MSGQECSPPAMLRLMTGGYTIRMRDGALYVLRKRLDVSRDELARMAGVSSSSAWRVESGQQTPGTRFIASILALSGATFDEMFEIHREGDN